MNYRDHCASLAMQTFITSKKDVDHMGDEIAEKAFDLADCMVAEQLKRFNRDKDKVSELDEVLNEIHADLAFTEKTLHMSPRKKALEVQREIEKRAQAPA